MGQLARRDIVIFAALILALLSIAICLMLFFPATNLSNLNTDLGTKF